MAKGEPSILVNLHDDRYHHNPVFYATLIKDEGLCVKMVEYLVSQGVEATSVDSLNQTPLYYACREGKLALIDLLIKEGCDINHLDSNGQSPLFYASREGHLEVVRRIIQQYAGLADIVDKNG